MGCGTTLQEAKNLFYEKRRKNNAFCEPALLQQYASRNIYAEARQRNKAEEHDFEDATQ